MGDEVKAVLASLEEREPAFREQVARMRAFKERMREGGAEVTQEKFKIDLSEGLAPPPRRVLMRA